MLVKPKNYDEIVINEDFERLELGAHKGIIKSVEQHTGQSGNISLKVCVDTSSDDKQPNYYQQQYDNNVSIDRKWPNGAIRYVSLKEEENCTKMLKGFITAVENSNNGFNYDWSKEESQLIGKKVGLVFGLEEFQRDDGKVVTTIKLVQFRSLDKLSEVKIPKVKLLNDTYMDIDDYKEYKENHSIENDVNHVLDDDEKDKFIQDNLLD